MSNTFGRFPRKLRFYLSSTSARLSSALIAISVVAFATSLFLSSFTAVLTSSTSLPKNGYVENRLNSKIITIQNLKQKLNFDSSFNPHQYDHPSQCFLLDTRGGPHQSTTYPFNARSFCLTSAMCIDRPSGTPFAKSALYFAAPPHATTCKNVTLSFTQNDVHPNCTQLQSLVHCTQGRFETPDVPTCPSVKSFANIPHENLTNARWLPDIVMLIPEFPHQQNIFHFSFVLGTISHILSALPYIHTSFGNAPQNRSSPLQVTLLFLGHSPKHEGQWQFELLQTIINTRLVKAQVNATIVSMQDDPYKMSSQLMCARSSLLIGNRSNINIWPFPSTLYPTTNGYEVGVEAIAFRHAVYTAMGIDTLLPPMTFGAFENFSTYALFDLPPLTIGYARRNSKPDAQEGKPQLGTKRRFSDADDKWFESMLNEEAFLANMTITTLQVSKETPIKEQVRMFSKVGFVAGIHGANLMNSIFMNPFSALLEIFPALSLQCYFAGANSGLAYYKYSPVRKATPKQSGCTEEHPTCWSYPHNRRVLISDPSDRIALRSLVRQGIQHVLTLHSNFRKFGGVPVVYDKNLSLFRIDWHFEHA